MLTIKTLNTTLFLHAEEILEVTAPSPTLERIEKDGKFLTIHSMVIITTSGVFELLDSFDELTAINKFITKAVTNYWAKQKE